MNGDQPTEERRGERALMAAMMAALFVSGLDISVVNVMLPKLEKVFNVPMETASLLAAIYASVMAALGLPLGRCSDLFSPVRVFALGVLFFGVGSLVCGLSTTFLTILIGRAVQGTGGAMLASSFGAVILQTIPKERTGSAVGAAMTVMSVGSLIGPPLGGYLASNQAWHWAFLLNVPLCITSFILLLPHLARDKKANNELSLERFDPGGTFLSVIVMLALPTGLHLVSNEGWRSPKVVGLLICAVAAWALFVRVERKVRFPLLPPDLFSNFRVRATALVKLLLFVALNGVMLIYPFFISSRSNLNVADAGWLMLACAVAMTCVTPVSGKLCDRFGTEGVMVFGSVSLALVSLASLQLTQQPDKATLAVSLAGFGLGIALTLVSSSVSFLKMAPKEHAGIFSAVNTLLSPLGGAIGMSVFPLLYSGYGFHTSMIGVMVTGSLMAATAAAIGLRARHAGA